jgi:hypothetical protein
MVSNAMVLMMAVLALLPGHRHKAGSPSWAFVIRTLKSHWRLTSGALNRLHSPERC